jgi:tRNA 2-thiouridine synthesizing protein A
MADHTLDAKGLNCPLPILKARKALKEVPDDGTLEILATDPGAVADFEAFCRQTGNELLEHSEDDGVYRFLIKTGLDFINTFTDVHSHAWHNARLCAGPLPLHRPVNMPAKQTNDVRVAAYDVLQCRGLVGPTVATNIMIINIKRRMVDEQQSRPAGLLT